MPYFKIHYVDGSTHVEKAFNALELIKKYDLATRKHAETRISILTGEQEAIAIANEQEDD